MVASAAALAPRWRVRKAKRVCALPREVVAEVLRKLGTLLAE